MKFTEEDIAYLRELGETDDEDIEQVRRAASKTKFTLYAKSDYEKGSDRGKKINRDSAIAVLGREGFLSGMDRSAFHMSALRESLDGKHYVGFDSRPFFRKDTFPD